ncbi:MAG: MurR/RpiR family transcriptional regulator, partial [Alkalibacterium sp.]|nr:MurR/RpiR family transcriptional regulator [Alkalibacterium sp.]
MYRVIHQMKERNFDREVTRSEKSVLDYLEEHFQMIPNETVVKIAQQSYTSQATINRASKLLGFDGFSDLKYAIKEDIENMKSTSTKHILNTDYILSKINFQSSDDLVKYIYSKRHHLLLFGLGASHISAQYMARQLLYLGIPAIVISESQMLKKFKDYSLVLLSSSGETQRCLQVAHDAKKTNIPVLSITKKDSSIMKESLITFHHDVAVDKMEG